MAKKRDVNRFRTGQMALSDAGHDRGKLYVILEVQGETLVLADGLRKTVEKPKIKKYMSCASDELHRPGN